MRPHSYIALPLKASIIVGHICTWNNCYNKVLNHFLNGVQLASTYACIIHNGRLSWIPMQQYNSIIAICIHAWCGEDVNYSQCSLLNNCVPQDSSIWRKKLVISLSEWFIVPQNYFQFLVLKFKIVLVSQY